MMNSKLDLFGQNWIDTIFEGRNKEYGAYELRTKESRITIKSFIIGAVIFSLLVSIPLIAEGLSDVFGKKQTIDEKVTMVNLEAPKQDKPKEDLPPPPPVEEMKSLKEVKKFTPPVVAPETEVVEEIVKQKELVDANAGAKNVDASADGEVVIDEKPVEHKVEEQVTESGPIPVEVVEVKPEFPGGMDAFNEYIVQNFTDIDLGGATELKLTLSFVVDKDGRLSEIKVLRDGGFPNMAKEAIRVLQKCPKWRPGVSGGRPVRVSYVKPITIRIQ